MKKLTTKAGKAELTSAWSEQCPQMGVYRLAGPAYTDMIARATWMGHAAVSCSDASRHGVPAAPTGTTGPTADAGASPTRADAALPPWLPTTPGDTAVTYRINPAHTGLQTADTFKPPFKQKWVKDFAAVGGAVVSYPLSWTVACTPSTTTTACCALSIRRPAGKTGRSTSGTRTRAKVCRRRQPHWAGSSSVGGGSGARVVARPVA